MTGFLVMVLIISAILPGLQGKVPEIYPMYPETNEYYCHCPNTKLMCNFTEDAITAGFYVLVNGIQQNCDGYPDHEVDLVNNALILTVNATDLSVDGNNYICTAVNADWSTATSEIWTLPKSEDLNATLSKVNATITKSSLDIKWFYKFEYCKKFTVYCDGTAVDECINMEPGTSRCHIRELQPSTTYEVTVIAMEPGVKDVTWSQNFTTVADPSDDQPCFCFILPGIFVCFVLPPLGCCVGVAVFAGIACCCNAKSKKAGRNGVGPNAKDTVHI